jgi:hypothetical protein
VGELLELVKPLVPDVDQYAEPIINTQFWQTSPM